MRYQAEEFLDNLEKHSDYYQVMSQYHDTELFCETIQFMESAFPEWRTNKGLGYSAAEFMLHCMDFLSLTNLEKRDNDLNHKSLKTVYLSVAEDYERFKRNYESAFLSSVLQKFHAEYENELEDEYLTDYRYNDLYDTFLKQELEKVTYDFVDLPEIES